MDSRYWSEQAFIRCYGSDDATLRINHGDVRWLGERLIDIASAIEARRAETHSGSVEDESAVAKPDAQGDAA
jgi:hypothetical protein